MPSTQQTILSATEAALLGFDQVDKTDSNPSIQSNYEILETSFKDFENKNSGISSLNLFDEEDDLLTISDIIAQTRKDEQMEQTESHFLSKSDMRSDVPNATGLAVLDGNGLFNGKHSIDEYISRRDMIMEDFGLEKYVKVTKWSMLAKAAMDGDAVTIQQVQQEAMTYNHKFSQEEEMAAFVLAALAGNPRCLSLLRRNCKCHYTVGGENDAYIAAALSGIPDSVGSVKSLTRFKFTPDSEEKAYIAACSLWHADAAKKVLVVNKHPINPEVHAQGQELLEI